MPPPDSPNRAALVAAATLIEDHVAEAYAAEAMVPGVEVHQDDDITWVVHCGSAWRNSGILLRFSPQQAARRLKTIVGRYQRHKRGAGFWISALSTPARLPELLSAARFHCRRHFPAMTRPLSAADAAPPAPSGIDIRPLQETRARPGSTTTARGRCEAERLRVLLDDPSRRTRVFVALQGGTEVGRVELFIGSACSGIHGITVHESLQGRGIGSALLERACREAAVAGSPLMVLLATTEGQRLYEKRGFTEIARFAYWYRSFQH